MVRACISPVGRTCHPRQVGSNPAVAHPAATVGAAKRQKAPVCCWDLMRLAAVRWTKGKFTGFKQAGPSRLLKRKGVGLLHRHRRKIILGRSIESGAARPVPRGSLAVDADSHPRNQRPFSCLAKADRVEFR